MAKLLPRPPHQTAFSAEPVWRNGRIDGVKVMVGSREVYLDLPKEEEVKLEKAIDMMAVESNIVVKAKRIMKKALHRA